MAKHYFFGICLLIALSSQSWAGDWKTVPWDSVVAEIKISEAMNINDSTRTRVLLDVFERFDVTQDDYRTFYEDLFIQTPDSQKKFVDKIKLILVDLQKKRDFKRPPPYQKAPPVTGQSNVKKE